MIQNNLHARVGRSAKRSGKGGASMIQKRWAGHFEILEPLGEGREGRVFVARDLRDNSEVALKLLHRLPDRLDKLEGVSLR